MKKLFNLIVFERKDKNRTTRKEKCGQSDTSEAEFRETKCLRTNRRRFRRGKSTNAPRSNLMHHPGIKIVPHAWFCDLDPRNPYPFLPNSKPEKLRGTKKMCATVFSLKV